MSPISEFATPQQSFHHGQNLFIQIEEIKSFMKQDEDLSPLLRTRKRKDSPTGESLFPIRLFG